MFLGDTTTDTLLPEFEAESCDLLSYPISLVVAVRSRAAARRWPDIERIDVGPRVAPRGPTAPRLRVHSVQITALSGEPDRLRAKTEARCDLRPGVASDIHLSSLTQPTFLRCR